MIDIQINLPLSKPNIKKRDTTVALSDMTWEDYESLANNNNSNYRISYYEQVITLMSPSRNHERIAQTITILINAYCRAFGIEYFALGSTDIRNPPHSAKQPDAQYCFNTEKDIPDLAVEVIYSGGGITDLDKYQNLNVKEVWLWQNNELKIYWLVGSSWNQVDHSKSLEKLTKSLLNKHICQGLTQGHLSIETKFVRELKTGISDLSEE